MGGDDGLRLLDLEPGLGRTLGAAVRAEATRAIVLPDIVLPPGPWLPAGLLEDDRVRGIPFGVLVVDGTLMTDLQLDRRRTSRLVTGGDIVLFDGIESDSLPTEETWTVLVRARVVVLDDRMLAACRRWPRLVTGLCGHLSAQAHQALRAQAISQLPQVEERLLAMLWSIADRRGVVGADGVAVPVPLTHDMLGRMVGAQRPTVSLGLRRLADLGHVRRTGDGWWLSHRSREHFRRPVDDAVPRAEQVPVDLPAGNASPRAAAPEPAMLVVGTGVGGAFASGGPSVRIAEGRDAALQAMGRGGVGVVVLVLRAPGDAAVAQAVVSALGASPASAAIRVLLVREADIEVPALLLGAAHEYAGERLPDEELLRRAAGQLAIAQALGPPAAAPR